MPNRPVASKISRSSRTSIVADRLYGSVPMITLPTVLPHPPEPSGSSARRATLLRAEQTPLEPLPASGARRDRTPEESHTNPPVGSREESVPSSTSTEPGPARAVAPVLRSRGAAVLICRTAGAARPAADGVRWRGRRGCLAGLVSGGPRCCSGSFTALGTYPWGDGLGR